MLGLLADEFIDPGDGHRATTAALIDALLVSLVRCELERAGSVAGESTPTVPDPAVKAALTAIHDDPGQPWRVADLARHVDLSRAASARRFTTAVGRPPMAYLTWYRMTLAARLLGPSNLPLSTVAKHVGYTSDTPSPPRSSATTAPPLAATATRCPTSLVARELGAGTHRLVWNQSVTRTRWLTTKQPGRSQRRGWRDRYALDLGP
ncbi:AraC family transcriptional regulator [Mycobacterium sp.]|uniref:helix-turn-helix transcriptional regulator n=1 Tax=Mycobacterium sp. TaxID=1785 RepID=UPI0033408AF8|nr:AraC family transcriptional regulator [Mycobacterium sp.]